MKAHFNVMHLRERLKLEGLGPNLVKVCPSFLMRKKAPSKHWGRKRKRRQSEA